jgi:hypothetical protein
VFIYISVSIGKKTIFVTGFADDVNEQELLQAFVTFGEPGRGPYLMVSSQAS